jgi:2-keto-4-pentenoate hydratase/2-oxohepta-3-ene-1,7-dioic acid hydratase in catechol pathway
MKAVKIERDGWTVEALLDGERIHVVGEWVQGNAVETPFTITSFSRGVAAASEVLSLSEVRLVPPVSPVAKIICLGLNYRNHVDETHNDLPENPALFIKLPDALVGHDHPILRPKVSSHFDYEGEIAVVIGKGGRHISREAAMSHIFGYTIMLDGSVRDYQKHSVTAGKNFWRSGSLGPWVVTADEIPDPTTLTLETRLNGTQVQHTTADLMLYDIPTAIAYISRWTPLAAGDVIATGTPGGVGARRVPPLWMTQGDRIEVAVSSIGVLANSVHDEL